MNRVKSQGREVVGPRLRRLLVIVFLLFAILSINSIYLAAVTLIEWAKASSIQGRFYQWMFLGHLLLGLLIVLPTIAYSILHWRNAHTHRNRRAVKAGYAALIVTLILLFSGLALTRGLPLLELRNPDARNIAYWLHIVSPLLLIWLFVLHRLAGRAIRWRAGIWVMGIATAVSLIAIVIQSQDPRRWNQSGPESGLQYFFPSLARTVDGQFIEADALMMDGYCKECHQDVHDSWAYSMHRFSSFNNPAYAFSVQKTREFLQQRDGDVQAVRFCAGCHDPVPFFSGAMDQSDFGDNDEPAASAGITCSVCHSITHINSSRGNADYTIEAPLHYPFATSEHPWLQWINQTLVKAKPEFHKNTFLKPLHSSSEFCASCHKVHLPKELNNYRWLRGQNHYDSFLLSGVSGHGVKSFYYPEQAQTNCNGCHMEWQPSADFGAKEYPGGDKLAVHNHQFAAANTGIPSMLNMPAWVNVQQEKMLQDSLRIDIFAIREGGRVDGTLIAPLDAEKLILEPGKKYLLEIVLRTLKLGHHFTQGTADSNQVWLHAEASSNGSIIAQSGERLKSDQSVDPWAHFVNAYVIDSEGRRIDRRNPENIFTQLYNNQIPPGASDVVHLSFQVPENQTSNILLKASLNYRKFDNQYLRQIEGESFGQNHLPITLIARDQIELRVAGGDTVTTTASPVAEWERWNDYGIGLLRSAQYRQAEQAFKQVELNGQGMGALNLARVYLREGRLDEAATALTRAATTDTPALPWSIAYFTANLNMQNGYLDEAIAGYRQLVDTRFQDARDRGFDFSRDYRLLNDLGRALAERAKMERGSAAEEQANVFRSEAIEWYNKTLAIDSENVTAHYALAQLYEQTGDADGATKHRQLHSRYKVDDNAKDRAVQLARKRDPAADRAANQVVIYQLD